MNPFALNPWTIIAVIAGLAVSHGAVAWKMHEWGGQAEKIACDKRVAIIQNKIDEQNREIARLNEEWAKRIDAVQDAYNRDLTQEAADNAALEKRLADYEDSIKADPDCTIRQSDVDRVRGNK